MRRPSLSILKRLCRDERGATAMEYGLIDSILESRKALAIGAGR